MINNKKSKILIGCLALLLVLSVGYAYFSQNITINGTATAKGEFDIGVTCQTGVDSSLATVDDFISMDPEVYVKEGGYKNDNCTVSGDTMSFSTEFEYPGAARYFTAKITNNGTIDASFDMDSGIQKSWKVYNDGNNNGVFDSDEILDSTIPEHNQAYLGSILNSYDIIDFYFPYGFEKADGTKISPFNGAPEEDVKDFSTEDDMVIRLKPGNSIYLLFMADYPSIWGGPTGGSFNFKVETKFTLNFVQLNSN